MVGGRRSNWKAIPGSLAGLSVTVGAAACFPSTLTPPLSLVPSITLLFFSGLPFPFFLFVLFLVFHPVFSALCLPLLSSPPEHLVVHTTVHPHYHLQPTPAQFPPTHPFPTDYINIYILSLFFSWLCQHILDCWALHVLQLVLMQLSNGDG